MKKEMLLFGIVAVAAIFLLLDLSRSMTGAVYMVCPEGYSHIEGYCIEDACREGVKCMVIGSFIRRPECVCMRYLDKILCGIKGVEETAVKSSNCVRRGQLDSVCGAYDSDKKMCVSSI
ncbi:MAG TPA: hypothetical protein VI612_01420 [Candidatus Nanoarchaeia archaeon]|nr:hypothetical protein [Candidatus Nanoarchaeia archaeon]